MDLRETRYLDTSEAKRMLESEPESDPEPALGTIESWQDALNGPNSRTLGPVALMRGVLDSIPAMIWAKRIPDGLMLICNDAAAEIGGTTRHEMEGTLPEQWWPKEYTDRWLIDDNEVATTGRGKAGYLERILHPKSGQVRWLRTHKAPVMDGQGVVFAILVFSYDVTDILPPSMRQPSS